MKQLMKGQKSYRLLLGTFTLLPLLHPFKIFNVNAVFNQNKARLSYSMPKVSPKLPQSTLTYHGATLQIPGILQGNFSQNERVLQDILMEF